VVKGSVTISLEDYHSFLESAIKNKDIESKFIIASKELQVFLSFLATRADIEKYVDEFNRQSKTSKIIFEGTTAKIKLKDE
tara:strand:+ start:1032 stop:1274 length:243 start_codon:yes stop_codon:yes gene_type:complete